MEIFDCEVCHSNNNDVIMLSSAMINGYVMLPQNDYVKWCSNCGSIHIEHNGKETWLLIGNHVFKNALEARQFYIKKKK